MKIIIIVICSLNVISASISNEKVPRVQTSLGKVKGYYKLSYKKQLYEAYEGIPYALPPIGNLRFEVRKPKVVRIKKNFLFLIYSTQNLKISHRNL